MTFTRGAPRRDGVWIASIILEAESRATATTSTFAGDQGNLIVVCTGKDGATTTIGE